MSLSEELGLPKPIAFRAHEAVLSIYYTASHMKKRADDFFKPYGLTDVQFNVMMLLKHQAAESGGLSQVQLSDMMLVNRANITSLIDRMEKGGLVERTAASNDRRFNIVKLTEKGRKLLEEVDAAYIKAVHDTVSPLKEGELDKLIEMLSRIRKAVK
jgi:DNA-binding MarR family transcriptional regulator